MIYVYRFCERGVTATLLKKRWYQMINGRLESVTFLLFKV